MFMLLNSINAVAYHEQILTIVGLFGLGKTNRLIRNALLVVLAVAALSIPIFSKEISGALAH